MIYREFSRGTEGLYGFSKLGVPLKGDMGL